jgi:hypothetical protein
MITIDQALLTQDITRLTNKFGRLGQLLRERVPEVTAPAVVKLMQIYEPAKSVTRKTAYGRTFQSRKQQRYFFWALAQGIIHVPHIRTFGMRNAWRIEGRGKETVVVNSTEAAKYTMGDDTQSRHEKLVGWHTTGWRLKHPGREVAQAAINGVRDAIKRAKLA